LGDAEVKSFERFIEYTKYPTMSDEESGTTPSTEKQLRLATALKDELISIGLTNAVVDEYGYVYASLESTLPYPTDSIGFIAHMDTSSEASDENVCATIHEYSGGDILINPDREIYLSAEEYPYLSHYVGHHIITSDGTTLIGADDKAGIAEIMTALERIVKEKLPHGRIAVAFTPDEEIGRGADKFNVSYFGADYAYTVDGGAVGEVEYENFNAARAIVTVHGVSIHPGAAKGKMKNASLIAFEFNSLLPPDRIPAKTEGYEGFYHLLTMAGEIELARLDYILRDHDAQKLEELKEIFIRAKDKLNAQYGVGTVDVNIKDSYRNMREIIEKKPYVVERAIKAMRDIGIEPRVQPIRGGTDGAMLSFMGLPCPNLCTGGHNFHSRFEFISCEEMERVTDLIVRIVENVANERKTT
jgi:tripeptide aminopeptidase